MMKKLLVLIFMLSIITSAHAYEYKYKEITGGVTREYTQKRTDAGFEIIGGDVYSSKLIYDKNGYTTSIEFVSGNVRYTMTLKDNQLSLKNGDIELKKKVSNNPWIGSFLDTTPLIRSDKDKLVFNLFFYDEEKNELSDMEWVAIKEGKEEVTLSNGTKYMTYKVKVTLNDWRGMFFGNYYWYDIKDLAIVKTIETRGPPGTPQTTVERL